MGLPVISARALTVSPTPTLRPPCLLGFLCRSCAPAHPTRAPMKAGDAAIIFLKILGSWKQVDTRTSGLRQRLECCQSPDTSGPPFSCGRTVTCDAHREVHRAGPPPNRRSRPNCDIGSGVVALGELQQLLRTGEITPEPPPSRCISQALQYPGPGRRLQVY
jgi:hypothetical protein